MKKSRATIISDEGGCVYGVIVRMLRPDEPIEDVEALAREALRERGVLEYGESTDEDVRESMRSMHKEHGFYRWVPRREGDDVRPYMEYAEPGARGSFLAVYWSYPP